MAESWTPPLQVREIGGRCRLWLGGYACGEGSTLQEAADDLVARVLTTVMGARSGWRLGSTDCPPPDFRWLEFLYELGEIAARGGDIRPRIFGDVAL